MGGQSELFGLGLMSKGTGEIHTHLVVHERKPVGHPKDESATCPRALVDIHGFENALQ